MNRPQPDILKMKTITMSSLGKFGRFGNQLFQYAALMIYAKEHGLNAQVPANWIGRKHFDVKCENITEILPHKDLGSDKTPIFKGNGDLAGHDIRGYFQYHTSNYAPYKRYFKELFAYEDDEWRSHSEKMNYRNNTLIGVHIRRGDYAKGIDRTAPTQWYLNWLKLNWDYVKNPILFLVSDEIDKVLTDFEYYKLRDNKFIWTGGDNFFIDHHILRHCDILLTSNSTFSFTAAMLNNKSPRCYRPNYEKQEILSFDPWDSNPISPFPHQLKVRSLRKLHLGCGHRRFDGYINIDCLKTPAVDKICDIRNLPYTENSIDEIACYHTLEHLEVCLMSNIDTRWGQKYESIVNLVDGWRNLLKQGGKLVIEVPDVDGIINEYVNADDKRKEELLVYIYGGYRMNDIQDIHRWGPNEYRLRYILEKAGFKDITFSEGTDYHAKTCPCLRVESVK